MNIAIYGKGGIGKSLVASNLSVLFSQMGFQVLHVGCDPKGDSTRNLQLERPIIALKELLQNKSLHLTPDQIMFRGRQGVTCIEAGGPEPGEGCGGMGILKLLQFLARQNFFEKSKFDIHIFDILGDIVCGGFAAPLKYAKPCAVLIVVSEELHSLYAANQIVKLVSKYNPRSISLLGLILNRRQLDTSVKHVHAFAAQIKTRILTTLPRDVAVFYADSRRIPVVVDSPNAPISSELKKLATHLINEVIKNKSLPGTKPRPMTPSEFDEFCIRWSEL